MKCWGARLWNWQKIKSPKIAALSETVHTHAHTPPHTPPSSLFSFFLCLPTIHPSCRSPLSISISLSTHCKCATSPRYFLSSLKKQNKHAHSLTFSLVTRSGLSHHRLNRFCSQAVTHYKPTHWCQFCNLPPCLLYKLHPFSCWAVIVFCKVGTGCPAARSVLCSLQDCWQRNTPHARFSVCLRLALWVCLVILGLHCAKGRAEMQRRVFLYRNAS